MSLIQFLVWAVIMLIGNIVTATYCTLNTILWFNGVWVLVLILMNWILPALKNRFG